MSETHIARTELRQSALLLVATSTTAILTFGFMMVAGRWLGPAASSDLFTGVFLLFGVHTLASPVATAVTRAVARRAAAGARGMARALTDRVMVVTVRFCAVIALGAVFSAPWLAGLLGMKTSVLVAAWLAALLIACATVLRGAMRGLQSFSALSVNLVAEAAVRVGAGVAALVLLRRADVAMGAYVVGALVIWPHLVRWRARALPRDAMPGDGDTPDREWLQDIWPLLALAVADAGFQNYDVIYVKRALSADHAGAYGAAATMSRALGVLVTPFVIQVVPLLADLDARNQRPHGALARLVGAYLALSMAALLMLTVLGAELLSLLFGEGFGTGSSVLAPHALGALAAYLAMVLAQGLAALGRLRFAWLYLAGFGAEVVVLPLVGETMEAVAMGLLAIKVAVLAFTMIAWWFAVADAKVTRTVA